MAPKKKYPLSLTLPPSSYTLLHMSDETHQETLARVDRNQIRSVSAPVPGSQTLLANNDRRTASSSSNYGLQEAFGGTQSLPGNPGKDPSFQPRTALPEQDSVPTYSRALQNRHLESERAVSQQSPAPALETDQDSSDPSNSIAEELDKCPGRAAVQPCSKVLSSLSSEHENLRVPAFSRDPQPSVQSSLCHNKLPSGSDGDEPPLAAEGRPATSSNDMATARFTPGGARRPNRYENQVPTSGGTAVLCRNGPQCRKFQEGTCHYNHNHASVSPNGLSNAAKKSLNVDSPSFTPKIPNAQPVKNMGISPKAAAAAAFTPSGSGTSTPAGPTHSKALSEEFVPQFFQPTQQIQEFIPAQNFLASQPMDAHAHLQPPMNNFDDSYLSQPTLGGLDNSHTPINPYAQQSSAMGAQSFFQDPTSFKHPLNYHLYTQIGPAREALLPYQRTTADFFIPDNLREDLTKKAEATIQTFANSSLPPIEHFHSLVALENTHTKAPSTFGYPSSIYKAQSQKDGNYYALRRIEGFRLTDSDAIRTINSWKRLKNSSLVQVHDAFTGKWFNDSSLMVVTDYHPNSRTLAELFFAPGRHGQRPQIIPENDLWSYIVQLASALKAIHESKLAAQTVVASKVLVTAKNRLRLNGCGILDITQFSQQPPLWQRQRDDLTDLGRLLLSLATRNPNAHTNPAKSLESVSRSYSERLRIGIAWLLSPRPLPQDADQESAHQNSGYNITEFLTNIADKVVATLDSTLHYEDELTHNLMSELENGRLVRLLARINIILERPDTASTPNAATNPALLNQPSASWSETGERYYLKLFRDYVFHQVDHEGRPSLDLGHIITSLNKLDAGIDEKIQLMSRDEQSIFIVSYKEIKRGFESAWADISKAANAGRR